MLGTYRRGEEVEIPAARAALGMFWAKKGLVAPVELLDSECRGSGCESTLTKSGDANTLSEHGGGL